uniref:Agmatinase n=1 Tax=Dictyoglomus thermophilum TaxID=14 RepID=A0A7C3MQZ1_DICTH
MDQYRPLPSFGGLSSFTIENSRVVIVPFPLEVTTTYKKGTREGPLSILLASYNIELYDEEIDDIPAKIGIFTFPDFFLPLGDLKKSLLNIEIIVKDILEKNKFPIFLGGEHTITKGILRAYLSMGYNFSVLHFDAHSDLREEYEGTEDSHACALREASERLNIVQVGIRSLSEGEREYIKKKANIKVFWDFKIHTKDFNMVIEDILTSIENENVYITFDFDVFNPSEMPATGTPEPGGLSWYEVLSILREIFKNKKVIGVDFVEFSPIPGLNYADYIAARLIYKIIGYYKKYNMEKTNG